MLLGLTFIQFLKSIFETIAKTAGAKRAIVSVARRLNGRIRACVINEKAYKFES